MAVIKVPDNMGGWIKFPALRGKRGPRGYEGIQGPKGESFTVDNQGTLNERDNFDLQAKGYSYLDVENGNLYIKNSNVNKDWSSPIPFGRGEKGEPFTYSDFTPSQLQNLKGEPGSVVTIQNIGGTLTWFIDGITTGISAQGIDGLDGTVITIGANNHWYLDGVDSGISAKGADGANGVNPNIGGNGNWYIDGVDTGIKAKGEDGDISNLTKSGVETALGYTINKSVPADAVFTDTPTDISGKVDKETGKSLMSNAEILRLSTVTNQDISNLVVKESGKGLSTNDYTTTEKNKLAGLSNYTHPTTPGNMHLPSGGTVGQVIKNTASGQGTWQDENTGGGVEPDVTKAYVDDRVKTPVPLGAVFTDTPTDISGKVDKETGKSLISNDEILRLASVTNQNISNLVVKETGKGLSANDYTTIEKNKLSGIAANANNYSLPTASASVLGGIKVGTGLTITGDVLSANTQTENSFTTTEKNKLAGIATGANNYTHPTTAGNKHIPTGGAVGQILKNTASGTATWQDEATPDVTKAYVDNKVKTDVPVGALFTDTITSINGKTGVILKTDLEDIGFKDGESIVNINPSSSIGQVRMWIGTQVQHDAQAPFDNDILIVIVG